MKNTGNKNRKQSKKLLLLIHNDNDNDRTVHQSKLCSINFIHSYNCHYKNSLKRNVHFV